MIVAALVSNLRDDDTQIVQWDDANPNDLAAKESTLNYFKDCGLEVQIKSCETVGPETDPPAVSWGDLSDLWEPGDR